MESIDGIMMIVFVLLMYFLFGLKGAGYGMVIAAFLDYLTLNVYMKLRYRYTLDKRSFLYLTKSIFSIVKVYGGCFITASAFLNNDIMQSAMLK